MKREQLFLILMLFCLNLLAQTERDTSILLPIVEISNSKATQAPGMVVNKIDSASKIVNQFNSVAELLSQNSPINIRNYGNGLLATINARGLGANHTSILWNGIPVNSSNLGLTDLSLLPVFLFDEVTIISGGTGPVYGNNSFGTAIELVNNSQKINALKISGIMGGYGSAATNLKLNYNNKNFTSATSFFNSYSQNNFEFKNHTLADKPVQKQLNGSHQQMGLMQIMNYTFNNDHSLRAGIWYQFSKREIPPLMFMLRNEEVQRDSSLRIFAQWKKTFGKFSLGNNLSFSREFIYYNNYLNNIKGASDVKNYRNELTIKLYPVNKFTIYSSVSAEIAIADILEYQQRKKLNKVSLNSNIKYNLSRTWTVGGGIKKEFTDLTDSPLALSAGIEGLLIKNVLETSASVSKVYSLPTLNDLYWKPGGNENLKTEAGLSSQLNFTYYYYKEGKLSITAFYSLINDWIQWIPNSSGLFSPVNIRKVESSGAEATVKQKVPFNMWIFSFSGSYSFTKAINKYFENNSELENKQLTYVPLHSANALVLISYRKAGLFANFEYTGERFTVADNSLLLEPYWLMHTGIMFDYSYGKFQFHIKPEIKNVFNEDYQPIPWRAMPGRSYFLTINMNINFK